MSSPTTLTEFRTAWLPNVTTDGLLRITDLLESHSPLLIHGAFARCVPLGCLASHIAWNHPTTAHLNEDAGVAWLTRVAGLNPATSAVVVDWDDRAGHDPDLWAELLTACRHELARRLGPDVGC